MEFRKKVASEVKYSNHQTTIKLTTHPRFHDLPKVEVRSEGRQGTVDTVSLSEEYENVQGSPLDYEGQ